MIPYVKPALILGTVLVVGGSGWAARGWFEDSKDLAAERAQQILADMTRGEMRKISATVENKLSTLKGSERIIDRGIIREVQKPVFRNVCIPDDSATFRMLNQIADGKAPREFTDEGTGDPAPAD